MPGLLSTLTSAGTTALSGNPVGGLLSAAGGVVSSLFGSGPPPVFRVDYGQEWLQPDMRRVHDGLQARFGLTFIQVRDIIAFDFARLGKRIRGEWEQLVWSYWGQNGENMATVFKAAMDRYNASLYAASPSAAPASVFAPAPAPVAAPIRTAPVSVFVPSVAAAVSAFAGTPAAATPVVPAPAAAETKKGLLGSLGDAIVKGGLGGAADVLGETEYGQSVKKEGAIQFLKDNWYIPLGITSIIAGLAVKAFNNNGR